MTLRPTTILAFALALASAACGAARHRQQASDRAFDGAAGAEARERSPSSPAYDPQADSVPDDSDVVSYAGEVSRDRLEAIRKRGIGQFMSSMDVEPAYKGEQFIGYRLLTAPSNWMNLKQGSLRAGDIVTEVNGLVLEGAPDAMRAWETMDFPDTLHVKFWRGRKKYHLIWRVVDPD